MDNLLIKSRHLPKAFLNTMYSDYDIERGDPRILVELQKWKPTPDKPSALFIGAPGLGKTMLACAYLNEQHARMPVKGGPIPEESAAALRQLRKPEYFIQLSELVSLQIRAFNLYEAALRGHCSMEEVTS